MLREAARSCQLTGAGKEILHLAERFESRADHLDRRAGSMTCAWFDWEHSEEAVALIKELHTIVDNDRYLLSAGIRAPSCGRNHREIRCRRQRSMRHRRDRNQKASARLKPYRGLPMTLGAAAATQVRLIVWCKAISIRLSPTLPKWPLGTSPKRPCSIGASGWCVPSEAAGRSIWC